MYALRIIELTIW